jgi:hypothetical protein
VKVSYQGKKIEGGYGTIQKCFIENDPAIPKHWAFAAKTQTLEEKRQSMTASMTTFSVVSD